MKVLVTGGRDFNASSFVCDALNRIHMTSPVACVIQGGAVGADCWARHWACINAISLVTYEANWEVYGNYAGRVRNAYMLRETRPDVVVAFQGGSGTRHMVRIAKEANVPVIETWEENAILKFFAMKAIA